jgi:hypothetical protein
MSCDNVNSGPSNPSYVAIGGTNTDAFGRLRVSEPYTVDNFRQINQVLETLQNQLNTAYQVDNTQEIQREIWFNMRSGNGC